ncbi:Ubiquitin carboxyl-terminal hydrolase CYLD [Trichoplax sp. H2]|nr:Ubiquitin carboxyl-terminal hydrolase CYLD [Trichoplax sp. H2]|eukprot:RDD43031.1 Ubiquitin carboxyl-terminal hydrolase CYLD [Trichoplax sp. H2]
MAANRYKDELERIANGKKYYYVIEAFETIATVVDTASYNHYIISPGDILSMDQSTRRGYRLHQAGNFRSPYQLKLKIESLKTPKIIKTVGKVIDHCTNRLSIVEAAILLGIRDVNERQKVYTETLDKVINAEIGDWIDITHGKHLYQLYQISDIVPAKNKKMHLVIRVSQPIHDIDTAARLYDFPADKVVFLSATKPQTDQNQRHSSKINNYNDEQTLDKTDADNLCTRNRNRNDQIFPMAYPEIPRRTMEVDENATRHAENLTHQESLRTQYNDHVKQYERSKTLPRLGDNNSYSRQLPSSSIDDTEVQRILKRSKETGISVTSDNTRNNQPKIREVDQGLYGGIATAANSNSNSRPESMSNVIAVTKGLTNVNPQHLHYGYPVLVVLNSTLYRGTVVSCRTESNEAVIEVIELRHIYEIRRTGLSNKDKHTVVVPYDFIFVDNSESVNEIRSYQGSTDIDIPRDFKSSRLENRPEDVWRRKNISKGGNNNTIKTETKKQSVKSNQEASSITTESTLQLLDSVAIGKRIAILDSNNKYGEVTKMRTLDELDFMERQKLSHSINDGVNIFVTVKLEKESAIYGQELITAVAKYIYSKTSKEVIVPLNMCRPIQSNRSSDLRVDERARQNFGDFDSPIVKDYIPPPSSLSTLMYGDNRGIQGHNNSCYLDCTLFSMFCCSSNFDEMLQPENFSNADGNLKEIQGCLSSGIVNCLRSHGFVRADRVARFRQILEATGQIKGVLDQEKDPEEFINFLMNLLWPKKPLLELKLISTNNSYDGNILQILGVRDPRETMPTLQNLYEKSMIFSDIKFAKKPSCLILQLPRNGQDKMFDKTFINLTLDISDQMENYIRRCLICGKIAKLECVACRKEKLFEKSFAHVSYCECCYDIVHSDSGRRMHSDDLKSLIKLQSEHDIDRPQTNDCNNNHRIQLNLFAVICISISHYVAFVRCGNKVDSNWCFYDSMFDRDITGYNIPRVERLDDVATWLSDHRYACEGYLNENVPDRLRRLFEDAYICMYSSD